jgi:hypothetical protein
MRATPTAFLIACVATVTLSAAQGPQVDLGTRAKGAEHVVVAGVADVHSTFDVSPYGDRIIVSHIQLQVEETLKGASATTLALTVEGGTVGELTLRVSDMPTLKVGERAVFFLDSAASGDHRSHGRGLGILKLDVSDRIQGSALTRGDVRSMVRAAVTEAGGQR